MRVDILFKLRGNPHLYRYLSENSYWYKYLNRDPASIYLMEEEMKKKYKLTTADKINNLGSKLNLIRSFMELMK